MVMRCTQQIEEKSTSRLSDVEYKYQNQGKRRRRTETTKKDADHDTHILLRRLSRDTPDRARVVKICKKIGYIASYGVHAQQLHEHGPFASFSLALRAGC